MRFFIAAVGHRMPGWVEAGFQEYARRMPRNAQFTLREIKPASRGADSGAMAIKRLLEIEQDRIDAALPAGCLRVVLDEGGTALSTRGLADRVGKWRERGRDVAFIIGSADGIAPELKAQADLIWSLSPLTLPHGLVRVVLAEQLYRVQSILKGHPYHRE